LVNTGIYDAYVDEMLAAKVAVGIELHEDPIAKFEKEGLSGILSSSKIIYSQWDEQRFNQFLIDAE
jgi:hypothetical protein